MRFLNLTITACILHGTLLHAQQGAYVEAGRPAVQRFGPADYGTSDQLWYIHESPQGLIYVSSSGSIHEYDGKQWNSIPSLSGRAISIHSHTKDIYAATDYDFGCLNPDSLGNLSLVSYKELLPEKEQSNDVMRKCFVADNGVYFASFYKLFQFKDGKFIRSWKAKAKFKRILIADSALYLLEDDHLGLFTLQHDSLTSLPGTELFSDKGVIGIFKKANGLLIITEHGEFYHYDGHTATLADQLPAWAQINYRCYIPVVQLRNGNFAFATRENGVLVFDAHGTFIQAIDKAAGMPDNLVNSMIVARDGSLWVAMDKGIARVALQSPATTYSDEDGLPGSVLSITRHQNTMYFGTMSGVFYLDTRNLLPGNQKIKRFHDITTETWDFLDDGNLLLAGNTLGIYEISGNKARMIAPDEYCRKLLRSKKDPSICWATTRTGILVLQKKKEQWKAVRKIDFSGSYCQYLYESTDGSLWVSAYNEGLYRLRFASADVVKAEPTIKHFTHADGLEEKATDRIFEIGNTFVVASAARLLEFDEQTERFRDQSIINLKGDERILRSVYRMSTNTQGQVLVNSRHGKLQDYNTVLLTPHGNEYVVDTMLWKRFTGMEFYTMYADGNVWWLGRSQGLIRADATVKETTPGYAALIRRVVVHEDSLIFRGLQKPLKVPVLPFSDNSLQFQAGALTFDNPEAMQFQYYLEGFDKDWSSWTTEYRKNYTNLPHGTYTFHLRACNIAGIISAEDSFSFIVLPPWYKSWWAYLVYMLSAVAAVLGVVRWQVARHIREKKRLEILIEERTHELVLKRNQLLQQTEKLREMDMLKSRFFANISHEFRTPLTLILAPLEQKLSIPTLPEPEKEAYLLMQRNASRLLELVNQLLDLSKIEAGKMKLHLAEGDLDAFLKVITASFDSWAQYKQIQFVKNLHIRGQPYWYDADKVEKIIGNVLSNAFKYTPAQGVVAITAIVEAADQGDVLKFRIRDTGKGIPEAEQHNVFSPFYQVYEGGDANPHGTGLGLSLVKELVNLYGGTLELESQVNKGTNITISLPLNKDGFTQELLSEEMRETVPANKRFPRGSFFTESINFSIDESGRGTILIVEDHPDLRDYLTSALQEKFIVLVASHGEEGLELAMKTIPDLIITDLMMPGIDGMELMSKVKGDERTSHIPVIMLTARNEPALRMSSWKSGADDFLPKPFSVEELISRVNNLIEQRKRLAEKYREKVVILPPAVEGQSLDDKFLKKIFDIVRQNMADDDFNVEKLAEELGTSRTQLFRKLKALTGMSPNEFIRDLRLSVAAGMIRQKSDTITQIGYAVGFNDQSYFAKCFRKKFGVSPSEYAEMDIVE